MIQAPEPHPDDEHDRQAELHREIGAGLRCVQRDEKTAYTFHHDDIGRPRQLHVRVRDGLQSDRRAGKLRRDMGGDRRLEGVGIDDSRPGAHRACLREGLDIRKAASFGSRGNRLHAHHRLPRPGKSAQQRAGDQGFADAGVGSGDEKTLTHARASRSRFRPGSRRR